MAKKDPRVRRGMQHISVWIEKELSDRLAVARDGRSLQTFVPRLLDEALDAREAREALAHLASQSKGDGNA